MKIKFILAILLILCVNCEKATEKESEEGSDNESNTKCYPVKTFSSESTRVNTVFLYDTNGRLSESIYTHWTPLVIVQKYNYDNEGKITECVTNTNEIYSNFTVSYDLKGRIDSIVILDREWFSTYEYNDNNQLYKVKFYFAPSRLNQYMLEYSSADDNNPVKVHAIDADGVPESITLKYDNYNLPFHNTEVNAPLLNLFYSQDNEFALYLTHNITQFTRYNVTGQLVEQINYKYTYNSDKFPIQKDYTFYDGEQRRDITKYYQYTYK